MGVKCSKGCCASSYSDPQRLRRLKTTEEQSVINTTTVAPLKNTNENKENNQSYHSLINNDNNRTLERKNTDELNLQTHLHSTMMDDSNLNNQSFLNVNTINNNNMGYKSTFDIPPPPPPDINDTISFVLYESYLIFEKGLKFKIVSYVLYIFCVCAELIALPWHKHA